ncbi:D-amino-acid transaminase [Delftia sp. ASV31]|uniref:D-amino-acid transaminase n=1 Tax=Delftia sp. ASV31 TaxID=2795113 RepID=UPI0018EBF6F4|nr:D-amino-acid transaminase [Delftia sp. ASV31]
MSRTVYVNGQWLPEEDAKISIFDRGFIFADAIYEVTAIADGKLIDFARHAARLSRSLELLGIPQVVTEKKLLELHKEIARRNNVTNGLVYLQISRGAEDRSFVYGQDLQPTVVLFTQLRPILSNPKWKTGITMRSTPDGRWANRHIKTTQLLYSSLSKVEAGREGFDDTLFVEDGLITESGSANFHVITRDGTLVTRGLSNALLHGITRGSILDVAQKAGLKTEERSFSLEEALQASEAFITDSISMVLPVVSIDNKPIGTGKPGPESQRLLTLYVDEKLSTGVSVG